MPLRQLRATRGAPNDIDEYAHIVDGVDSHQYFDTQARDAWLSAVMRWPVLAELLTVRAAAQQKKPVAGKSDN